ncbi:SprT-like domain-containing protein [Terrimonas pollutisoli]|uniref:SprT-like domain-containing protein n=1 Tax=Terrimonas pollutisoli TaxID=3034147 RepID=UPI0023ED3466|nr:SprT-like domain-containing protein [Terrimonas sp. H1YJ31]
MPKKEVPIGQLQDYLPPGTYEAVLDYLRQHKVHLTIARERKSILGDYRHRTHHDNHRISVNGNLNPYSFLITLLHELAHLLTFEQFGNRVLAHGREWKIIYAGMLAQFLQHKIFPQDIEAELILSLNNPAASTCAEDGLLRVLRKYDSKQTHHRLVEEISMDAYFRTSDGRIFKKQEKLRKRFRCIEVKTGKVYLFSPVYEVEWLNAG